MPRAYKQINNCDHKLKFRLYNISRALHPRRSDHVRRDTHRLFVAQGALRSGRPKRNARPEKGS